MSRRSVLETEIQRQIEADIGAAPDLLLIRNSVGEAKFINEDDGREYHVPYGLGVGSPDLVGILRTPFGWGAWFCLEIKTPEDPDPRPEQEKCHRIWRDFGAFVFTVHSREEARKALATVRATVQRAMGVA